MGKNAVTLIIGIAFIITQLSTTLLLPALPHLANSLGSRIDLIKLILSVFFFGYAIGQLLWGSLSDRLGRKPLLIIAMLLYSLFTLLITYSANFIGFALSYASLGFAAAAYTSLGNAIIKDIHHQNAGRIIAYIGIAMASGPAIGPIIGGQLLQWFNWRAIFILLFIISLTNLAAIIALMPETHQKAKQQIARQQAFKQICNSILNNHQYLAYIFCLGLVFGAGYVYLNNVPFIYQNYFNSSKAQFGYLFGAASISAMVGAFIFSQCIQRIGCYRLTLAGLSIGVISTILLALISWLHAYNLLVISILSFTLLFSFGIVVPGSKAGAMLSTKQYNGSAASLMKFTQTIICLGMLSSTAAISIQNSLLPLAIFLMASTLLALLIFIGLHYNERVKHSSRCIIA